MSSAQAPRILGPLEGRRHGRLTTDILIHDLSAGGCMVNSYHEEPLGRRFTIDIHLPGEGWLTLNGEAIHSMPDYGFAMRLTDLSDSARTTLERAIQRLIEESGGTP